MDKKKSKATPSVLTADQEFVTAVDELTEAIVEGLEEGYHSDLEPFEAYSQRIRGEIHSDITEFRTRFLQGYEVLLGELAKQCEKEERHKSEPPPGFKV